MDETKIYKKDDLEDEMIEKIFLEVVEALKLRGYDATGQIVGYLTVLI